MNKGIMENKRNPVFNDTKKPKKLDSKEDVRRLDFKGKPIQKQTNGDKIVHVKGVPAYSSTMEPVDISYVNEEIVGSGSFGSVYKINLSDKNGTKCAAIKKVLQDKRFKNRELVIMRKIQHTNIVDFYYHFFSHDEKNDVCLNLIMEYIPETLYHEARRYSRLKQSMPIIYVQLYMYQLFRSLAYIHSKQICHRDIKPHNLLIFTDRGILKLCDFGSSKQLISGEANVSYICSRYYRAPELIFGATDYTSQIDVWSSGCVMAELLLGQPIFPGESGVDQLVEIIKILGTPTSDEIKKMNANYTDYRFPPVKPHVWSKVFRPRTPKEASDLISQLLKYISKKRYTPLQACCSPFFDNLREHGTKLPNSNKLPPLFNFTSEELEIEPALIDTLIPPHTRKKDEGAQSTKPLDPIEDAPTPKNVSKKTEL